MQVYNTFKAKEYRLETYLGDGVAKEVKVKLLVDGVTRSTFDQDKHEHLLDSGEVERLSLAAAELYVKSHYLPILKGEKQVTADEIAGVRIVLGLNASQLAQILGLTRGTMSKLLKSKLRLKRPEAILLTERLIAELQDHGYWKRYFSDKKHKDIRSNVA